MSFVIPFQDVTVLGGSMGVCHAKKIFKVDNPSHFLENGFAKMVSCGYYLVHIFFIVSWSFGCWLILILAAYIGIDRGPKH